MPIKSNMKDLTPARERFSRDIQLLSGGRVNEKHFPDGKIKVYPWDNQVDDWIANRLRKGALKGQTLLFHVFPRVCDLNGCPFEKFVASEVMSVLMVSRAALRNDVIEFDAVCPHCENEHRGNKLKIPDQLERIGQKTANWPGFDLITLPDCKDVVKVRPVTVGEEIAVLDRTDQLRNSTCSDAVARFFAGVIAINDSSEFNIKEILEWFRALSPIDADYALAEFEKAQPQLSTTVHMKCDGCGKEFDHGLQLNEDFFRRPSPASSGGTVSAPVRAGVQVQGPDTQPRPSAGPGHPLAPRQAQKPR